MAINSVQHCVLCNNIGSKHRFPRINVCQVPEGDVVNPGHRPRFPTSPEEPGKHGWLVGCFGFNGPLRQYFSLYRAVSQREGERGEKG